MKQLKLLLLTLPLALTSCGLDIYLKRPEDTNLEFWITQNVSDEEMKEKGCTFLPGWFGAREYLDSRYTAVLKSETSSNGAPEQSVTYLVTGYPDTLDSSTVTVITITDPAIYVYGLTMKSSQEDIVNRMKQLKAKKVEERRYKIKTATFGFYEQCISISVPVTNKKHVIY